MSVFETLRLVEHIKEIFKVSIESIDFTKLKSEDKPMEPVGSSVPNVPNVPQQSSIPK